MELDSGTSPVDDDEDVADFLAPPPNPAQPHSHLSTSHNASGAQDDDDDDFFLRREGPLVGGVPSRQSALSNEASIVQELEKEAAHWKVQYETCQRLRLQDAEREQQWKDTLARELQLLFHNMVVRRLSAENALQTYHQREPNEHGVGSSPNFNPLLGGSSSVRSIHAVGQGGVRSFLRDAVLAHVDLPLSSPWDEREEIDRSDGGDMNPSTPSAQRGPASWITSASHSANSRSAARLLRRQRSVMRPLQSPDGPVRSTTSEKIDIAPSSGAAATAALTFRGGPQPLQDAHVSRYWRGSPAAASATTAVEAFSSVLQHHRQAKARTQLVGCAVLVASTTSALLRGAWNKWLRWSAIKARQRIPKPVRWRRSLAVLTRDALHLRFVIHGTMASAWLRWHLFVRLRRLQRSVNRLMAQQAAHGALMGSLIKTQNAVWVQFVEDAAVLLEQQFSELNVLGSGGIPQLLPLQENGPAPDEVVPADEVSSADDA